MSLEPMTEEEYSEIDNINALSTENRWRLYSYWHSLYLKHLCKKCEQKLQHHNQLCATQEMAKKKCDRYTLENAEIIGMTTTGAAKYQHILHLVKPRIVIVEEAAEVLESHIVSALNAGTQHLILIGDHRQLKPKPNVYKLAKKYNLDVSLFERLILNNFPHATLEIQHRMRPEIAEVIKEAHIYDIAIKNHPLVNEYPVVRGVGSNLFFIEHECLEKEDEQLMSHSNEAEAKYLVALCRYLLQQRYAPTQITILVTYSGQLLSVRRLMRREDFEGVRISTVDNFQGEENDIILLSLVRSNEDSNVGFLREDNRVCVALSRAREGFYCIGNFKMFREAVPIWETIVSYLETVGKIGRGLHLHCSNHPDVNFIAKSPEDFIINSPKGGCTKDCLFRLPCGHVCADKCHYTDPEHTSYSCKKKCAKSCPEDHPCPKRCCELCRCNVIVTKTIPRCEHDQKMECHIEPLEKNCNNPCRHKCPRGHPCPFKCSLPCKPCSVMILEVMPSCHHEQEMKCSEDVHKVKCVSDCSHTCKNGHPCLKWCYETCGECTVPVSKLIPECGHNVSLLCYVEPDHKDCTKPCEKSLPCTHKCKLLCGEDCSSCKCKRMVTVSLPECGHEIKVECHMSQSKENILCDKKCDRKLPCGHPCSEKCSDPCKEQCTVTVNKEWPCGHKLKRSCYQISTPENYPCEKKCEVKLECGHLCSQKCGEICDLDSDCTAKVRRLYPCGHTMEVACSSTPKEVPCIYICTFMLACGHSCSGKCSLCSTRRIHEPCRYQHTLKRFCGHSMTVQCVGLTDVHPAKKNFSIVCSHKSTDSTCSNDVYHVCEELCTWSCPHFSCSKKCSEICDRPRCNQRCEQRLKCGHICYGLCGEPCLSFCPECQVSKFKKKLRFIDQFDKDMLYYQLRCDHIFTVEYLDKYVHDMQDSKSDVLVNLLQCPVKGCVNYPISCSYRYGNSMKASLSLVQDINGILGDSSIPQPNEDVLRRKIAELAHSKAINGGDIRWAVYYKLKALPQISSALAKIKRMNSFRNEEIYVVYLFVEAFKSLELIDFDNADKDVHFLVELKRFLIFLSELINKHHFKLSYQTAEDLKSEFFMLYLKLHCFNVSEIPAISAAKMFLESKPSHYKVTRSDFCHHMEAFIDDTCDLLQYTDILSDLDTFYPVVQRGHWWKCTKGHYYCSPLSQLPNIKLECPKCIGIHNMDYVHIPKQSEIAPQIVPRTQAAHISTADLAPVNKSSGIRAGPRPKQVFPEKMPEQYFDSGFPSPIGKGIGGSGGGGDGGGGGGDGRGRRRRGGGRVRGGSGYGSGYGRGRRH